MKNAVFCLTVLLVAGAGAQWLETIVPVDSNPTMLCYNPQNDFVYSANWGADNVTVINGATNEVDTAIAVGVEPHAIYYSPLNNKVFCFNEGSMTFSVIDGATNTIEATESLGTRPWDAVRCPVNDKFYVLGHSPDVVKVVNCATYDVEATIAFSQDPYGVCYDSTDNRVYVSTRTDSTVWAIDCAADTIVAAIKVGPAPNKLCWNSRENKVYTATADGLDSTVTIIDCVTDTVVASLRPGRYPQRLGYDPAQSRVYVSCYTSRAVAVVDGAGDSVVATVPTSSTPEGLLAVPEHGYVFAAVSNDTVLVLDGLTGSVVVRVGVGRDPTSFVYNSRDDRVYSTDYFGATVSILRASGGVEETRRAEVRATRRTPAIVRGVLLMGDRGPGTGDRMELLDVGGRKVKELKTGANDLRFLAPGVYFVRLTAGDFRATEKVVLQK